MIWAAVNRVFLIGISSFILTRKFYFRIRLRSEGDYRIVAALGHCRHRPVQQISLVFGKINFFQDTFKRSTHGRGCSV